MNKRSQVTLDGNEAAAYVAFRTNEVIAIYPITPSSNMGEHSDAWAAEGKKNLWGAVPIVQEMQSEAGAAGAIHGSLQAGALSTTFTASQGLLLMIPNMFKIAGELTSTVFHISARAVACQALSIFGDHSDAMAVRNTGWGMMFSNSVQEVMDMALMAQASTLRGRVPILHAFDGFRTSHEVQKIEILTDEDMLAMLDSDLIRAHRERALSPDRPIMRGTAQNPDVYFQGREAANKFYEAMPDVVQGEMDRFAKLVGRQYHLFDYAGAADAERVVVAMGSGAETVEETVENLVGNGEKVGIVKVRLYRPFSAKHLLAALPSTVKTIAVLDRTKEPGSAGEPLYQDVLTAVAQGVADGTAPFAAMPRVFGGRYGLGSKEFTPGMAKAVFDEAKKDAPKNSFTVGITDDNSGTSLDYDAAFENTTEGLVEAMFWGLGADGTVGANKNSVKIIGEETPNYAQGYFVYDSKKSGNVTTSHLRFGPKPIHSPYLINKASFVAVHQFTLLEAYPVLDNAKEGATFLLNAHFSANEVWDHIPLKVQQQIIEKKLKMWVMDAYDVAKRTNMGARINTIMQTCFFALSAVLPREAAIGEIKHAIEKTYSRKGQAVVEKNFAAVDQTLAGLQQVLIGSSVDGRELPPVVPAAAPDFVQRVTATMLAGKGDLLPVSAFPVDGTWPVGTSKYEKRNIADEIPVWEPSLCIQCNKCAIVCPHSAIRVKGVPQEALEGAPATLKTMPYKGAEAKGGAYVLQVAPEDCTGCTLCLKVCPGKDKADPQRLALAMAAKTPRVETERDNFAFFLDLPEIERADIKLSLKSTQLIQPLFEFSGACLGCGETPYVKLLTQLFGDRMLIANATGCSSIFGGNLPTTPYTTDRHGRGPAWSNSLFEDNAEFGLGFRLALDQHKRQAQALLRTLAPELPDGLAAGLIDADLGSDAGIRSQRERIDALRTALAGRQDAAAQRLDELADYLAEKVVWIIGGDGWAYDIGYGGLDHVLASGRNVNILVMDTEVYSNTGGQQSKATPLGAAAKFATAGKMRPKKDLGQIAMTYGNVYVASVAFGAKDQQTVRALQDAASYDGVSLVIAYAHCIAHGYDMASGLERQKAAVAAGYWPLYRYDPRKHASGENPFKLDSSEPTLPLADFMESEGRFRITERAHPDHYREMVAEADTLMRERYAHLRTLAGGDEDGDA